MIERFVVDTFVPVAGINTAYIEEAVGQIDIILGRLKEQGVQVPDAMSGLTANLRIFRGAYRSSKRGAYRVQP